MLRILHLYGDLSEKYGKEHRLNVGSIGEALRAMDANKPGFLKSIKRDGEYEVVRGDSLKGEHLCADQLSMEYGKGDFHIAPVVEGAGEDGGIIMTIVGFILIVVGCLLILTPFGAPILAAGIGLMVGGIATMISPTPNLDEYGDQEKPDERNSFYFSGPTNTTEQGGVLPLVYGRMVVGSVVVSAGIKVEAI